MALKKNLELDVDLEVVQLRELRDKLARTSPADRKAVAALIDEALAQVDTHVEGIAAQALQADEELSAQLEQFTELEAERVALEAALKRNAEKIDALAGENGTLLQKWLSMGMSTLRIKGRTYYTRSERWLFRKSDVDKDKALTALRRAGLGSLITTSANAQSLRGWLAERAERIINGESIPLIPKGLSRFYEPKTRTTLNSRKSK